VLKALPLQFLLHCDWLCIPYMQPHFWRQSRGSTVYVSNVLGIIIRLKKVGIFFEIILCNFLIGINCFIPSHMMILNVSYISSTELSEGVRKLSQLNCLYLETL